jgi:hypothetical protein
MPLHAACQPPGRAPFVPQKRRVEIDFHSAASPTFNP